MGAKCIGNSMSIFNSYAHLHKTTLFEIAFSAKTSEGSYPSVARRICGHAVPNVEISCLFRTRGKKAWGSEDVNLGFDDLRARKSGSFGPRGTRAYWNPRGVLSVSSQSVLIRGVALIPEFISV